MKKKRIFGFLGITLMLVISVMWSFPAETFAAKTPVEDKVAVLITSWGAPNGYCPEYAWRSHEACRVGDKTDYPGQPCKLGHVGDYPFQSHIGILPWFLAFETPGFELLYDNSGIYWKNETTGYYEHISGDSNYNVLITSIPPYMVKPVVQVTDMMTGELLYPPDPRDGTDHLEGWYKIGSYMPEFFRRPNGWGDLYEQGPLTFMRYTRILNRPTDPPDAYMESPHAIESTELTKERLEREFGDKIDVRFGVYNKVTGYTEFEGDVAKDFADEGFRKMLLARETTDNNNYANEFMTGNYVKEALCEAGVLEQMEIYHTRQIGRTPEFNAMNVENLEKHIEKYPEGSRIGIIYVTRGLPWDRSETPSGPMAAPHPWSKEVYHENAYLNYLSWKKAIRKAFGDKYILDFTKGSDDSDKREDNFYSYGTEPEERLGGENRKFKTLRDVIQEAKADGIDKMIIASCHWLYDCLDNLQINREVNGLPLQSDEELAEEMYYKTHCEDTDGNEETCGSPDAVAEITQAESFSHLNEEFATSYYVVLRGGLERFGLFPQSADIQVEASQLVTKLEGGVVEVKHGKSKIKRAKIEIPADPYPDRPQDFTPETAVPINDPNDTNDCLWEDVVVNIGYQSNAPGMEGITPLGQAVHFGPYRNIFNRDVTITLPYLEEATQPENVSVYIYNELTKGWDSIPVETMNSKKKLVTIRTQVLGLFQVGEKP